IQGARLVQVARLAQTEGVLPVKVMAPFAMVLKRLQYPDEGHVTVWACAAAARSSSRTTTAAVPGRRTGARSRLPRARPVVPSDASRAGHVRRLVGRVDLQPLSAMGKYEARDDSVHTGAPANRPTATCVPRPSRPGGALLSSVRHGTRRSPHGGGVVT